MNRSLAALILIPLAIAGAACSDEKAESTDTTAGPATSADAQVTIADFAFDAPEIRVSLGGSVTWTNTDDQAHTATSSGSFDAGTIDPGQSSTVEFTTAGTFTYVCAFHPFMNGTIVVE